MCSEQEAQVTSRPEPRGSSFLWPPPGPLAPGAAEPGAAPRACPLPSSLLTLARGCRHRACLWAPRVGLLGTKISWGALA